MTTNLAANHPSAEEIAGALCALGVDADVERLEQLQARIAAAGLPAGERGMAVRSAVEVANRALDAEQSSEAMAIVPRISRNAFDANSATHRGWRQAVSRSVNGWGLVDMERHRVVLVKGRSLVHFEALGSDLSHPVPMSESMKKVALAAAIEWAKQHRDLPVADADSAHDVDKLADAGDESLHTAPGSDAGAASLDQQASQVLKVPLVIGRNRLRGAAHGAMVEDLDGEHLTALRAALRFEAERADVEPTAEWLNKTVSQLLRMYDEAQAAYVADKGDAVGHVFEAALPSGKTLLFGEAAVLARIGPATIADANSKLRNAVEAPSESTTLEP